MPIVFRPIERHPGDNVFDHASKTTEKQGEFRDLDAPRSLSGARARTGDLGIMKPTSSSGENENNQGAHNNLDDRCASDNGSSAAKCAALPVNDPEFAHVVSAWPTLPEAIRVGILAMVRAASRG